MRLSVTPVTNGKQPSQAIIFKQRVSRFEV